MVGLVRLTSSLQLQTMIKSTHYDFVQKIIKSNHLCQIDPIRPKPVRFNWFDWFFDFFPGLWGAKLLKRRLQSNKIKNSLKITNNSSTYTHEWKRFVIFRVLHFSLGKWQAPSLSLSLYIQIFEYIISWL